MAPHLTLVLVSLSLSFSPPSHHTPGSTRVRHSLVAPSAAHILCVDRDTGEPEPPLERLAATSARSRAARWLQDKRVGVCFALATTVLFGGARPSLAAARRSFTPPDVEQAFRKETFTADRLVSLGINPSKIITKDFLFSESRHRVSEAQQEMYSYDDIDEEMDSGRTLALAAFATVSVLGGKLLMNTGSGIERWMKSRDEMERLKEIELTGTYVNPFAGDVEEVEDAVTGEKSKIEKKKGPEGEDAPDDGSATASGESGTKPGGPKGGPKGGSQLPDTDADGKTNVDILSDLL